MTGRCRLTGAAWYSWYDDATITSARGIDIDHMVPLAEAHDSGGYPWTAQRRQAYANDLGDDRALAAVSARSNRRKADQDPTDWPPRKEARCTHAEHQVLTDVAAACPNRVITVQIGP
ncbi:hypothetical protein AQ490_25540 [Wenjunlia vitaminophila]|uniref:DUF1524 domain-containing protein n=1 Tax=Wenjunlia vitaminophila TaxID=76728 RepID=A0A0T6LQU6_WENVI|nr:DUF1524 domain-containing protein [Wenjunlia vitaminophila]KRV48376.1 hypothetical protein AQ490_25540 [Wenjunlia vitaminophila]